MEKLPSNLGDIGKLEGSDTEYYSRRIEELISRPLTVETIDSYADSAIFELTALVESVKDRFKAEQPDTLLEGKALEDAAFAKYKLREVDSILDLAGQMLQKLNAYDQIVKKVLAKVITPSEPSLTDIPRGEGTFSVRLVPRFKTLLYILDTDFKLPPESLEIYEGVISGGMMRRESYVTVLVPQLHRMVQVCDEEGNASYVFDTTVLEEQAIAIQKLDDMNKTEKVALVEQVPTIGRKISQSSHWRDIISELLRSEITPYVPERKTDTTEGSAGVKVPSYGELDPWRGSWTDPDTGKHYGNIEVIAQKFNKKKNRIESIIEQFSFASIKIRNISGLPARGFCYEDFLNEPLIKEKLLTPTVESEGEWSGFFQDSAGKHWGYSSALARKLGVSVHVINAYINKERVLKVEDKAGRVEDAYCYEDIKENTEFKEFSALPRTEKGGEWKGFFVDKDGQHWGSVYALSLKMKISRNILRAFFLQNSNLPKKRILNSINVEQEAYCFEEVEKILSKK